MEVVWPSAGRALELLRGSKVNQEAYDFIKSSSRRVRNKRSAERSLDDAFERGHLPNTAPNYSDLRAEPFGSASFSAAEEVYPKDLDLQAPSANHTTYFPSHERWPSSSSLAFAGTLSTSVLPQLYSTGLVDDCLSSGISRMPSAVDQSGHGNSNRYPQYWNDYSTFPQLGMAYGGVPAPSPAPASHTPPLHSSASHTPPIQPPNVYFSELYNVYNNHGSNS